MVITVRRVVVLSRQFRLLCVVCCVLCAQPTLNPEPFVAPVACSTQPPQPPPPSQHHIIAHHILLTSLHTAPLLTSTTKRYREQHDICQVVNSAVEVA